MAIVFSPRVLGMWCCVVAILMTSVGHSSVVTFGDSKAVWDGWGPPPGNVPVTQDEHGIPIIPGTPGTEESVGKSAGSATFANGYLTQITVNYWVPTDKRTSGYIQAWESLLPGDLFLDVGGLASFSHVVRPDDGGYGTAWTLGALNGRIGYAPGDSANYILADKKDRSGASWPTNVITREYHPWAVANGVWDGRIAGDDIPTTFGGWVANLSDFGNSVRTMTWDFGSEGLWIGSQTDLTIGFTLNCANDVLLETITSPILPSQPADTDPIPEPHAFAIWSLMALSGGWWAHRRLRPAKKAEGGGGVE